MAKYNKQQLWQYETICTVIMLVLSFSTLCAAIKHSVKIKSFVYARVVLAIMCMVIYYTLQGVFLIH